MKRIVMTVADRPWYLEQTLHSWQQVRGVEDWFFHFFVEPGNRLASVKQRLKEFPLPHRTTVNRQRLGVLENPYRAMSTAFEDGAEFTVLAEEDVVVSDDILDFFSFCSDRFVADTQVLGVCANHRYPTAVEPLKGVFRLPLFNPLVWGTWKDRWDSLIGPTWDHDYSSGKVDGSASGWDWHLNLRVLPDNNMHLILPTNARSDHIGEILGAHMHPIQFSASLAPTFRNVFGEGTWTEVDPPFTREDLFVY